VFETAAPTRTRARCWRPCRAIGGRRVTLDFAAGGRAAQPRATCRAAAASAPAARLVQDVLRGWRSRGPARGSDGRARRMPLRVEARPRVRARLTGPAGASVDSMSPGVVSTMSRRPTGRCRASTTSRWNASASISKPGSSSACSAPSGCGQDDRAQDAGRLRAPDGRTDPHGRSPGDGRQSRPGAWYSRATTRSTAGLTAVENVEFGPAACGASAPLRGAERAMRYLELVGLEGQEQKYPAELSGGIEAAHPDRAGAGERAEDAAHGRALRPRWTRRTRSLMQLELANIWRATRTTVLFITHDHRRGGSRSGKAHRRDAGPDPARR